MKKFKIPFILFATIVTVGIMYFSSFYVEGPEIFAKSYILIDAETQAILAGANTDTPLPAASMTKLMTEYIVLKEISEGRLQWDDQITITEQTAQSQGVKIEVEPGTKVSVKDLYSSMVIGSANNAAVALAERIAGSEEGFTKLMNEQAQKLGLSEQSVFVNSTGLQNQLNKESIMTAKDVAILAAHLIQDYPEVLETAKLPVYILDYNGSPVHTTNRMLHTNNQSLWFKGVDGLKTGFTDEAGYCFSGTAKQGDTRLISVVMGTNETDARFIETKKLFAYGFQEPHMIDIKSYVKAIRQSIKPLLTEKLFVNG
ncbi:D-alanyl-D-alanine carboxypeptidase family protein [Bacillus sp. AK128]